MVSVTRTDLRKLEARAWRDGRWWTFEIPGLTALAPSGARIVAMAQASTLAELDAAAQDVAALWLGIESTHGITQRDAARILGVSPGRVSQLANR